jgi:hypothetical protein
MRAVHALRNQATFSPFECHHTIGTVTTNGKNGHLGDESITYLLENSHLACVRFYMHIDCVQTALFIPPGEASQDIVHDGYPSAPAHPYPLTLDSITKGSNPIW